MNTHPKQRYFVLIYPSSQRACNGIQRFSLSSYQKDIPGNIA